MEAPPARLMPMANLGAAHPVSVNMAAAAAAAAVASQHHGGEGGGRGYHHQNQVLHKQGVVGSTASSSGSSGVLPLKYQEMSPEVTLVEFISTSAAFHGVKRQNIKQLEWDILKVFPNNIMPANAAAWYMAKRRFYMGNTYEYQLLPFLLKNYPKKFAVKGNMVEFLETYTKEVARKKMQQMIKQGLLAYFQHKVEEYGVYFFDPYYYETTEPFHANLRVVTNSHGAHRSKLLPNFFSQHESHFVFQAHSPYLVTISKQLVEVKINTVGIVVSMVDNQFGIIQFPSGTGTEKALFSAKSLFKDGWLYQGDPRKLPPMEFDGYRVPNLSSGAGGGGGQSGKGDHKGAGAGVDYTWYAVLVWCGRKPSPKYCATKEDLTSSPYFQNVQNTLPPPGLPLGNMLAHQQPHHHQHHQSQQQQGLSFEELSQAARDHGRKRHQQQHQLSDPKLPCMQVGEVLAIRKTGAVVSLGKDSDEQACIPGWAHRNIKYKGSFLTTTQGVELAIGDLITFCVDPAQPEVKPYKFVGCNVTVLKHADDKGKSVSATSSATLLPAGDASSSATTLPSKDGANGHVIAAGGGGQTADGKGGKRKKGAKKGNGKNTKATNDSSSKSKSRDGGRKKSEGGDSSTNEREEDGGNRRSQKSAAASKKGRKGSSNSTSGGGVANGGGGKETKQDNGRGGEKKRTKKKSESNGGKPLRERAPKVPYYLKYLLAPPKSKGRKVENEEAEEENKGEEGTTTTTVPAKSVPQPPPQLESDSESEYDSDIDPSFVPPSSHDPELDYDEYSDGEVPEDEEKMLLSEANEDFTEDMREDLKRKLEEFEKGPEKTEAEEKKPAAPFGDFSGEKAPKEAGANANAVAEEKKKGGKDDSPAANAGKEKSSDEAAKEMEEGGACEKTPQESSADKDSGEKAGGDGGKETSESAAATEVEQKS